MHPRKKATGILERVGTNRPATINVEVSAKADANAIAVAAVYAQLAVADALESVSSSILHLDMTEISGIGIALSDIAKAIENGTNVP